MKLINNTSHPESLMFILRNQFQLTDQELLSLQICAFTSIRDLIYSRSVEGNVYDAHLLFSNYDSAAAKELRKDILMRCEDLISERLSISPLLVKRMSAETVDEVIQFITDHFKKNSFESILDYFKLNEEHLSVMLYN